MYFKVKYDVLNDTGRYLVNKSEEIDKLVNEIKTLSVALKNHWNGKDYESFINSYNKNLKKVTATTIELNALGNALCKVSGIYQGLDYEFENKLQKMRNDNYE